MKVSGFSGDIISRVKIKAFLVSMTYSLEYVLLIQWRVNILDNISLVEIFVASVILSRGM